MSIWFYVFSLQKTSYKILLLSIKRLLDRFGCDIYLITQKFAIYCLVNRWSEEVERVSNSCLPDPLVVMFGTKYLGKFALNFITAHLLSLLTTWFKNKNKKPSDSFTFWNFDDYVSLDLSYKSALLNRWH